MQTAPFGILPPEMSVQVFGFLEARDAAAAMLTCTEWYSAIANDGQLWRTYYAKAAGEDPDQAFYDALANRWPPDKDGPFWRRFLHALAIPTASDIAPPRFFASSNRRLCHTRARCAGKRARTLELAEILRRTPCDNCSSAWFEELVTGGSPDATRDGVPAAGRLHQIVQFAGYDPDFGLGPVLLDYPVAYTTNPRRRDGAPVRYVHRLYAGELAGATPHGCGVEAIILKVRGSGGARVEAIGTYAGDVRAAATALRPSRAVHLYAGQFVAGRRSGYGICAFANGMRYDGQWDLGFMHGNGVAILPDGEVYSGRWHDGRCQHQERDRARTDDTAARE